MLPTINIYSTAYTEGADPVRLMNAGLLGADDVVADGGKMPDEMEKVVRRHIKNVFLKYAQNLSRASEALKISRNTLRKYVSEN